MESQVVSKQTKYAISAVALLSFLGILIETSLNVALPSLTREFSVSLGTMQWVTSGYLLMVTIIMSTTGFLTKKFSVRTLFTVAIIFNLIGTIFCLLASVFPVLLLGRLLQAISTGISTPLMYHLVLSLIPQSKRGVYIGFAAMIISLAPALGPTYGGTLTAFWSWRGIFIIALFLLIITALLGETYIRLPAKNTTQKFDWLGVILLTIMFVSLSLAFADAANAGFQSLKFVSLLLAFIVFASLLLLHLKRSENKILNFSILHQPVIRLRLINFFVLQFINIGISIVIPIFTEENLHLSAFSAGLILLPGSLLGAAVSPYAGKLFDRHGSYVPLISSSILLLIGTSLFFVTTSVATAFSITTIYILLRVGFNLGFSTSMSDASMHIESELNADLNSLFNTFQQFAGSFGTNVLAAVISVKQLEHGSKALLTVQGTKIDYALLVILALISLGTVLLSRKYKTR